MKNSILKLAAISLTCAMAIAAQDLGGLAKQAQNFGGIDSIAALTQKLHLTPQQLQQVLPILQKEIPQLQAIQNKAGLTNTQKIDQTKTVQKQSDSKLKGLLSAEQFKSLQGFRSLQKQQILQGTLPELK
jgi:NADP-dependent 3-hydroxy acid dehydrogenase YdfG